MPKSVAFIPALSMKIVRAALSGGT